MNETQVLDYVKAAAALLELPLDDGRAQAVAVHLGRTWVMAQQLEKFPLQAQDEMSEIFCPAPFPDVGNRA